MKQRGPHNGGKWMCFAIGSKWTGATWDINRPEQEMSHFTTAPERKSVEFSESTATMRVKQRGSMGGVSHSWMSWANTPKGEPP